MPLCPSARSEQPESQIFGVVGGTVAAPMVNYLKETQGSSEYLAKLDGTKITPEEVFRIAAPCDEKGCQHFDGQDCRLAMRVVEQLPAVIDGLPPCAIRRSCRWWQQEGKDACFRCPQVVTDHHNPSDLVIDVARPQHIF
jgi:hypothetical protein